MEASEAQAGTDGAQAPADAGAEQATETPAVDMERLSQRLDELGSNFNEFRDAFAVEDDQQLEPQQGYEDPSYQPQDPYGGVPGQPDAYDQYGEMNNDQAMQELSRMVTTEAQRAVAPIVEQQQDFLREQHVLALEEQYPELREQEVAQQVVSKAQELAEGMGRPEQAMDPAFIELVFKAGKAEQSAASETPAGTSQGAQLEQGGVANPGQPEQDAGDAIVAATKKHPLW